MGMTKKERKIAILKDVLAQLKVEKFKATTGSYVSLPQELGSKLYDGEEYDAKTELLACKKACKVCAKGSIFLSTVRKENETYLSELNWDMEDSENNATQRVVKLFGGNNLNKIEAAFEKWYYIIKKDSYDDFQYYSNCDYDAVKDEKIVAFAKKYPNKKDRLVAIVKNCIKNEGIFKP